MVVQILRLILGLGGAITHVYRGRESPRPFRKVYSPETGSHSLQGQDCQSAGLGSASRHLDGSTYQGRKYFIVKKYPKQMLAILPIKEPQNGLSSTAILRKIPSQ